MTIEQERHLRQIITSFSMIANTKYKKGQEEHGGNLFDLSPLQLVDCAIDEAVDQVVYLLTLKDTLLNSFNNKMRYDDNGE